MSEASKIWYELHMNVGSETRTIQTATDINELHARINSIREHGFVYSNGHVYELENVSLHIDKWRNPNNPELIESIQ